ncbi:MAG TPA: response regulator [Elusimicrobiota bacterium]|nr:response regulator [Elusimicrobiota bacterium]
MKKKILVVEDERAIAEYLEALLGLSGYTIQISMDGKAAVEQAREWFPDLVLLDIMLPKLNGFDVCKILKQDAALKNVPIIMLTSLSQMGDVERAFDSGANDYLSKPIDAERLVQKIKKYLPE